MLFMAHCIPYAFMFWEEIKPRIDGPITKNFTGPIAYHISGVAVTGFFLFLHY